MEIVAKPLKDLDFAHYNPRKDLGPSDPEYQKLKKSIAEFGMVDPVVWNKRTGRVVGGHQTLKVLREIRVTRRFSGQRLHHHQAGYRWVA